MAHPFGKAPSWKRVFQVLEEFGGSHSKASFECKDGLPVYKLELNGKELFYPIGDENECLTPTLVKHITRQLGLPPNALGEHYK